MDPEISKEVNEAIQEIGQEDRPPTPEPVSLNNLGKQKQNVPPPAYLNTVTKGLTELKKNFVKDENYIFESEKLNIYLDYWLGTLFINIFTNQQTTNSNLDSRNTLIQAFVNDLLNEFYFKFVLLEGQGNQGNAEPDPDRKLVMDSFNKNFFNKISNKSVFDPMLSKLHISKGTNTEEINKNKEKLITFICDNLLKSQLVRNFCLDCIIDQRSRTQKMRGMSKNGKQESKINYFKFINKIKMFYFPYLNILYDKDENGNFVERTEIPVDLERSEMNTISESLISNQASKIINKFVKNHLSSSQKVEHRNQELKDLSQTRGNKAKRGAQETGKKVKGSISGLGQGVSSILGTAALST